MKTAIFKVYLLFGLVMASATAADYVEPVKSPIDPKQYRYLTLDNSLRVLLVSDPDTDKAGASLDVHIGNSSDPAEWQGLAHFLEHMLFLGNGKYPEPGEYQNYINANGGSNNAYTAFGHTNYFFNVAQDKLEPALDRFSRFFIDPTFDPTFVDRERAVVHSEYQARRKEEGRRIWAANKALINPGHPASNFAVGSLDTLRDRDGITARDKLIEFYDQYYSANLMTLAVVGRESLDQLETWVREKFSEVPNKDVLKPKFIQSYFNRELLPARIHIVPEERQQQVMFQFEIESTQQF